MSFESIQDQLLQLVAQLRYVLLTDGVFRGKIIPILDAVATQGYDLRIEIHDLDREELLASYDPTPPGDRKKQLGVRELAENWAVHCNAEFWSYESRKISGSQFNALLDYLRDVFWLHWGTRDPKVLLRRFQDQETLARLLNFAEDGEPEDDFIVMYFDLDSFGKLNREHGEPAGNSALSEYGKRVRETFDEIGITTRTFSGDEFSVFFRTQETIPLLKRIEKFRARMESEPIPIISQPKTSSIGLAIYHPAPFEKFSDGDHILAYARSAEQRAKSDGKNCIRISVSAPPSIIAGDNLQAVLAVAALRCRLDLHRESPTTLSTPYAHFAAAELALRLTSLPLADCEKAVWDVKQIYGLQIAPVSRNEEDGRLSDWVSICDWAALIAWALLRSSFASGAPLMPDDHLYFVITPIDEIQSSLHLQVVRNGKANTIEIVRFEPQPVAKIPIGAPWYCHTQANAKLRRWVPADATPVAPTALLPALLLLVGENGASIAGCATNLAAAIVTVDDRPVKGGGLPDFWQSNLTRVIWACLLNPNIQKIIVVGDVASAAQTVDWLRAPADRWSQANYELQRMLAIPGNHLASFKERNLEVRVVEDTTCLYEALSKASLELGPLAATSSIDLKSELRREGRIQSSHPDDANRLLVTDGLRSRTLADAYPRALQILRSQTEESQTEKPGRRFTEVQSFKLVLMDPLQDMVPEYWRSSEQALRDYYERNFKEPEGLSQHQLSISHGEGNETEFSHALRMCIESLRVGRPSRRVTLPLSAYPEGHRDPIGWFSIQIFPRLRDDRWRLDFNWIWRTVEVLVGFPFSVYGSINWSREFCEAVQAEVGKGIKPVPVEFGQLLY